MLKRGSWRAWMLATVLASAGCATQDEAALSTPYEALSVAPLHDWAFPSNYRDWEADVGRLPLAERQGDTIKIRNVRDFIYEADDEYVVQYADRVYDLRTLESVDFIVVPFKNASSLAHTMLSFGFADGDYLGVSVEARLEVGEEYSPLKGILRQYELIYVVADERDLVTRRTQHRDVDVFLYRTIATAEQAQALFVDVMERVNKLAVQPEFYDTLSNNCTTNIVDHVNQLRAGAISLDLRVMLPGFSDRLAYDLGLLETDRSFYETRRRARVNELANRHFDDDAFSQRIRRR